VAQQASSSAAAALEQMQRQVTELKAAKQAAEHLRDHHCMDSQSKSALLEELQAAEEAATRRARDAEAARDAALLLRDAAEAEVRGMRSEVAAAADQLQQLQQHATGTDMAAQLLEQQRDSVREQNDTLKVHHPLAPNKSTACMIP
jgi:hypothetical protein